MPSLFLTHTNCLPVFLFVTPLYPPSQTNRQPSSQGGGRGGLGGEGKLHCRNRHYHTGLSLMVVKTFFSVMDLPESFKTLLEKKPWHTCFCIPAPWPLPLLLLLLPSANLKGQKKTLLGPAAGEQWNIIHCLSAAAHVLTWVQMCIINLISSHIYLYHRSPPPTTKINWKK